MTYASFEMSAGGYAALKQELGKENITYLVWDDVTTGVDVAGGVELEVKVCDEIGKDEVWDGVTIELSTHDVPATDNADLTYNMRMRIRMSWDDARRLHAFLGAALQMGPLET